MACPAVDALYLDGYFDIDICFTRYRKRIIEIKSNVYTEAPLLGTHSCDAEVYGAERDRGSRFFFFFYFFLFLRVSSATTAPMRPCR